MGPLFALLGMAFCVALIFQMNADHAKIILTLTIVAAVNWFVVRARRQASIFSQRFSTRS